jgi:hypothetical protein
MTNIPDSCSIDATLKPIPELILGTSGMEEREKLVGGFTAQWLSGSCALNRTTVFT